MHTISVARTDYKKIGTLLRAGGVVVYPTDTAYALGCDATNQDAVKKVFTIKTREQAKSLPLIAADLKMVERFFMLSDAERSLAHRYWPGPLTLVLSVRGTALTPEIIRESRAAVRVPNSAVAQAISAACGAPIVSTSANISGGATPYSVSAIQDLLVSGRDAIDVIIDAGTLPERPVSTIVSLTEQGMDILRQGELRITGM